MPTSLFFWKYILICFIIKTFIILKNLGKIETDFEKSLKKNWKSIWLSWSGEKQEYIIRIFVIGRSDYKERKSVLNIHWKDWCWSWNSNTLSTWCKELIHLKRPCCWERLKAGGEGDHKGQDGWMASLTQWTWVWVNSGSWWWTGRPGVLQFMGSQLVRHDWATELNWRNYSAWILISNMVAIRSLQFS